MRDSRLDNLANVLVNHSVKLQKGEHVSIVADIIAKDLVKAIVKEVYNVGAIPHVVLHDEDISLEVRKGVTNEYYDMEVKWQKQVASDISASISMRGVNNDYTYANISSEIKRMGSIRMREVSDIIIDERKWVLLNYPTYSSAQNAKMSLDDFSDFLLDVCTINYKKMNEAFKPLKALMEKTDKVRIVGPNTDLCFSIKGIPAIPCSGECNIPDGEIFTAPIKNSVNGTITYNTLSPYQGILYKNVSLTFKDGKIIECTADNDQEKLAEIFNTDEGAKYVGEFAIGINPLIRKPMGDILFDEKITGSLHFTPGCCYKNEADNGNYSAIHWDLVLIQTKEYGGGKIYFDDILIREDGIFVLDELKGLNPENLL